MYVIYLIARVTMGTGKGRFESFLYFEFLAVDRC
jgi:hypothetical protein